MFRFKTLVFGVFPLSPPRTIIFWGFGVSGFCNLRDLDLGIPDFVTFGILYFGAFLDSPYPPPGSSFFGVFGDFGVFVVSG